ncbi:MAG: hypothetical protein AAF456_02230 [Planctomycetota bacterium]
MSVFRKGRWQIASVLVNSETVLNSEGFRQLDVSGDEIAIEPAGFRFKVQQSTPKSAVLELNGRVYFADFSIKEDTIHLKLSRPEMDEKINIEAEFEGAFV